TEVRAFSDRQIDLLKTFANQAVIAIENARRFEEVQAKTRELEETLEYQTATNDVLNVISRSPSQLQPVFELIAEKGLDSCQARSGGVYRFDGELIHEAAIHRFRAEAIAPLRQVYPMRPGRGGASARAILSRTTVYIADIREDPEYALQALAKANA